MEGFNKKIKNLNDAYQNIRAGIELIKLIVSHNGDIDTCLWRLEKNIKELNKVILKQLKKENLDDEFKRITKDFK